MKLIEFFKNKKYMMLIFSIIGGLGYFLIVNGLILTSTKFGGEFLSFLFCPAIICGAALYILKTVKRFIEEENPKGMIFIVISHLVILAAGVLITIERILIS